jgi:hypothetical protein
MGKTLKRQRAREAAAAAGTTARPPKRAAGGGAPPPGAAAKAAGKQQNPAFLGARTPGQGQGVRRSGRSGRGAARRAARPERARGGRRGAARRCRRRRYRLTPDSPAAPRAPVPVDAALKAHDWGAAVAHLRAMRAAGRRPKLGSIMRWVRDADATGSEAQAARVICAVLQAAEPPPVGAPAAAAAVDGGAAPNAAAANGGAAAAAAAANGGAAGAAAAGGGEAEPDGPPVRRYPAWVPPAAAAAEGPGEAACAATDESAAAAASEAAAAETAAAGEAGGGPANAAAPRRPAFYEIQRAPGAGGQDSFVTGVPARIFAYPPGAAVAFDAAHPPPFRAEVPHVPGAFVIVGALSRRECRQILDAGHALGYRGDVDYSFNAASGGGGGGAAAKGAAGGAAAGGGGGGGGASAARAVAAAAAGLGPSAGRPAEGCVWLVDDSVLAPLWRRVAALLPQELCGCALAGINPRWRLYRYSPGGVFRPHVDGAWPGSGLDAQGRYLFDARGGRQWSLLTFLIYLNDSHGDGDGGGAANNIAAAAAGAGDAAAAGSGDDGDDGSAGFEGGATAFFVPRPGADGRLDAHSVRPAAGNVLVFVHGTAGALVHEGSAVMRGAKYVVRTEVLYTKPAAAGAAAAAR